MRHQHISFLKSAIRISGYFLLASISQLAAIVLIGSELLGIIEEVGHE